MIKPYLLLLKVKSGTLKVFVACNLFFFPSSFIISKELNIIVSIYNIMNLIFFVLFFKLYF